MAKCVARLQTPGQRLHHPTNRPARPPRSIVLARAMHDSRADIAAVWAALNGLVIAGPHPNTTIHAPISLYPVPFPKDEFERAVECMPLLNLLFDRIAQDEPFLTATLQSAAAHDDFIAKLLDILHASAEARREHRTVALAINRSDYMLDVPSGRLLQVEMNTIASSFAALATRTAQLHQFLDEKHDSLPVNASLDSLVDGLATAARLVMERAPSTTCTILMVVQPGERNVYDQQWLQQELLGRYRVHTVRLTLEEIAQHATVDPHTGLLMINNTAIHLVYFRAGYSPHDYPSQKAWDARLLMERSSTARCPDVAYQLAGAKKVQQVLAGKGVVEQFLNEDEAGRVRALFAGLWSLDDPAAPIIQDAIHTPHNYVLKPQREGGGNNIYGNDIPMFLKTQPESLPAYILMQRIQPAIRSTTMLREGCVVECDGVSELGVYGVLVRTGDGEVMINKSAGHLVRTKAADSDEGGVAAGFAVLDSPSLRGV